MRWVYGENNHFDERDGEFVTSLVFDLKYAIRIAQELGHEDDAEMWQSWITSITDSYEEWFFPNQEDTDGKVWPVIQKVYLDADRDEAPFGDDTEGEPYLTEDGTWVRPGWSFYTSTAFVMNELDDEYMARIMKRFEDDYDPDKQLMGLGDFAVKAPDVLAVDLWLARYGHVRQWQLQGVIWTRTLRILGNHVKSSLTVNSRCELDEPRDGQVRVVRRGLRGRRRHWRQRDCAGRSPLPLWNLELHRFHIHGKRCTDRLREPGIRFVGPEPQAVSVD